MEDDRDTGITILLMLAFCIVGIIGGCENARKTLHKQAVTKGHAEWVVNDSGETEFKWKEINK